MEIKGKYTTAKVFTDNIESTAIGQILELCNQEFVKDSSIRIMPDVHAGKGCVIGTTMTVKDKVVPSIVGVDIGCGMLLVELGKRPNINFNQLDDIINRYVPVGTNVHDKNNLSDVSIKNRLAHIRCRKHLNMDRAYKSIGTLGGGNHFIELNKDLNDNIYLVIHSGSRNLGKQIAEYYQNVATIKNKQNKIEISKIVESLKKEGRQNEIENKIKELKQSYVKTPDHLSYVEGNDFEDYMNDMMIATEYASFNRLSIAWTILKNMDIISETWFQTVHNYIEPWIDGKSYIIRKGAVSAYKDEKLLIPLTMKDGSLICIGKGNNDWNMSAPHGAGRIMSRSEAKKSLDVEEFKDDMKNIHSSTIGQSTLDESPRAYKNPDEIINAIQDTCEIITRIYPIYNFKSE